MRITSTMMMDNYQKSLMDNLDNINTNSEQMSTQKKFTKASQDPIAAMKALKANHSLKTVEQYQSSCTEMTSFMQATEAAVKTVNSILLDAGSLITGASNGTNNSSDDKNNAVALQNYQQEILQTLNSSFNGRYVFGGAEDGNPPFKVGEASDGAANVGKLMYRNYSASGLSYVPVSSINSTTIGSYNLTMPVDMGMGMRLDGSGNVVKGTVFEAATSALGFLTLNETGTGATATTTNIFDMLGKATTEMQAGDHSNLSSYMGIIDSTRTAVLDVNVDLGDRSSMISFLSDKLTNDNLNLTQKLSDLQDTDITLAATNYQVSQMVYDSSLAISSHVLQKSLIDFLR